MSKVLNLAEKVLNDNSTPMTAKEIFDYAKNHYKDDVENTFSGKTPEHTLLSRLYVDTKKQNSKFIKFKTGASAAKFGLKNKEYSESSSSNEVENNKNNENFKEKDLHRFLVSFMKDQGIYCKTINANKSDNNKKGKNSWVHPDIIGVKFLKEIYEGCTMELMKLNNVSPYELYSFELKKSINSLSELDDYYLQAAANSSWSNYGYLVAKDINTADDDLMEKIKRLNTTFGIGVIKLDVESYSDSEIVFEADMKEIDYNFIDNLLKLNNTDIKEFFKEITYICGSGKPDIVSDIFDEAFESDKDGYDVAKQKNML